MLHHFTSSVACAAQSSKAVVEKSLRVCESLRVCLSVRVTCCACAHQSAMCFAFMHARNLHMCVCVRARTCAGCGCVCARMRLCKCAHLYVIVRSPGSKDPQETSEGLLAVDPRSLHPSRRQHVCRVELAGLQICKKIRQ